MKRDQHKSNKTSALREEAEKKIKPESVPIEKLSEAEVRKLAHELQVHKIELDMQNEELKRSQQELEDSRDRYARLYDFAPAGYFTINDKGAIVEVNLAGASMLGVERGRLIKQPLSKFMAKEDSGKYYKYLNLAFKEQVQEYDVIELRMIREDGTELYVQLRYAAEQGTDGHASQCKIIITDITIRVKSEKAEKEVKELFRALFEQTRGYAMILDPSSSGIPIILDVNKAACEAHGWRREEMIGRPVADLDDEEGKRQCIERTKLIMSGKALSIETTHVRKDGSSFPVAVHANVVRLLDKPPVILTTEYDISHIRQKNEEINRLAKFPSENPNPVLRVFITGNILYRNDASTSLLGFWDCQTSRILPEKYIKIVADTLESGLSNTIDVEHNDHVMSLTFAPIVSEGYVNIYGLDVTKRRELSARLENIERKSRTWLEYSPVCTKIVDLDFNLQYMSTAGIEALEIDDVTLLYGKPYPFDFYPESFRNLMVKNLNKAKETGEVITQEAAVVDKYGKPLWFNSTIVPVNDNEGRVDYIIVVSSDTTERHKAEQEIKLLNESLEQRVVDRTAELKKKNIELNQEIGGRKKVEARLYESERQTRLWLNNSPVCTKIVDLDFNLRFMSTAGIKALKIDDITQFYGKPYPSDFFPEAFKKSMTKNLEKVKGTGVVITEETLLTDVKGNEMWFNATILPVNDIENRIDYIMVVSVDITEQKKMEETLLQSEKLKSLGTITAGISHEFNNILNIISGKVQLLEMDYNDNSELMSDLSTIMKAVDDGVSITDNMLKITSSSKNTSAFMPFDINELLKESIEFTKPRWKSMAQANSIDYIIDQKGMGNVPQLLCDPTGIREVFINIINNALDAMPNGGSISFCTWSKDDNLFVSISDAGKGMTKVVKYHMFDPFFTTRCPEGTGLGLGIAFGIITRHGGKIDVESEEGKGATFNLSFPIQKDAIRKMVPSGPDRRITIRKLHILVIDDNEDACEIMDDVLARSGHVVKTVDNGVEAVVLAGKEDFDLILCDLLMPNMHGYDVIKIINKLDKIPKIGIITGWEEKLKSIDDEEFKVDFILKKPFEHAELAKHINDLFGEGG